MQTEKGIVKTEADYLAQNRGLSLEQLQDEINKLNRRILELKSLQAKEMIYKKQYEDQ
ncbi:unnamed protein product [Paramecium sonneborni]|uniref:Uncharacterized protein n=1 Tax=Paramecium sonneborni TaxID=65129 RepID=A0A8S1NUN2_9CILI|nr:unnamed protein product [Paramecium sonneborni]